MIEIERPKIEIAEISENGTYGKFVVEPLERGFGTTLGNSLRRVLLSSLPGVAVKSVKIDGVLHEFSTIPGVKEDVTEIILNIKGLVAKLHCDGPKTVEISAEGPCVVTADSIKCDSEVEILNPDLHIATLGEGAKLYMELTLDSAGLFLTQGGASGSVSWSEVTKLAVLKKMMIFYMGRRQIHLVPLERVEPGDFVQLRLQGDSFGHCPVVVAMGRPPRPDTLLVAAHSDDADFRPLSTYPYRQVRFLHITGVRRG